MTGPSWPVGGLGGGAGRLGPPPPRRIPPPGRTPKGRKDTLVSEEKFLPGRAGSALLRKPSE